MAVHSWAVQVRGIYQKQSRFGSFFPAGVPESPPRSEALEAEETRRAKLIFFLCGIVDYRRVYRFCSSFFSLFKEGGGQLASLCRSSSQKKHAPVRFKRKPSQVYIRLKQRGIARIDISSGFG
jgi:hypothetical protein